MSKGQTFPDAIVFPDGTIRLVSVVYAVSTYGSDLVLVYKSNGGELFAILTGLTRA
jgi:hypothetical protein